MQAERKLLNSDRILFLTSVGHPRDNPACQMETGIPVTKRKDSRKAAYPLRFKTKTQKERLERAARKSGKSLRDFILDHAMQAAETVLEVKAS